MYIYMLYVLINLYHFYMCVYILSSLIFITHHYVMFWPTPPNTPWASQCKIGSYSTDDIWP